MRTSATHAARSANWWRTSANAVRTASNSSRPTPAQSERPLRNRPLHSGSGHGGCVCCVQSMLRSSGDTVHCGHLSGTHAMQTGWPQGWPTPSAMRPHAHFSVALWTSSCCVVSDHGRDDVKAACTYEARQYELRPVADPKNLVEPLLTVSEGDALDGRYSPRLRRERKRWWGT